MVIRKDKLTKNENYICMECGNQIVTCQLHFNFCSHLCRWTFDEKIKYIIKENEYLKQKIDELKKVAIKPPFKKDLFS